MLEVSVLHEDVPIKTYEFNSDTITVGRLPENSIPIASISVSRRHLKIDKSGPRSYTLNDLKSLNGTFINDQKVATAEITGGETVIIGKYALHFEITDSDESISQTKIFNEPNSMAEASVPPQGNVQATPPPPPPSQQQPAQDHTHSIARSSSVGDISSEEQVFNVKNEEPVLIDTNKHVIYKIDKDVLSIGNSETDDIFVEGFMISDGHVIIEKALEGTMISANKMMGKFKINGKKETKHILSHKDRIEIGNTTFRYMENGSGQ